MYRVWKADPRAVHASWDSFFKNVDAGHAPGAAFTPPPGVQSFAYAAGGAGPTAAAASSADLEKAVMERLALSHLIRAYSVRGHEVAVLDPLNLRNKAIASIPELDCLMNAGRRT